MEDLTVEQKLEIIKFATNDELCYNRILEFIDNLEINTDTIELISAIDVVFRVCRYKFTGLI